MRDSVQVSVESDHGDESVRIHDDTGEVSAGEATFRFSIDGVEAEDGGTNDSSSSADEHHRETANREDGRDPCFVAPVAQIPSGSTLRCEAISGRRGTEIILKRENDGTVVAWRNSCPHKPKVSLDPGDGAIVDDGQLVCHEHGARFECGDGFCTYGPCRGDALSEIDVEVRDGDVYLADERFDACTRLE